MKRLVCMLVVLLCLSGGTCWAKTMEEARVLLSQLRIDYTEQEFFNRITTHDLFAVNLFLDAGMNPNIVRSNGTTPLKIAVIYNYQDIAKALISRGADSNWRDNNGRAAIDIAQIRGYDEMVAILQGYGMEVIPSVLPSAYAKLDSVKIASAVKVGKEAVTEQKDLFYAAKDNEKVSGGFLGAEVQLMAKAYAMSPYCLIANASLRSAKKYEPIDEEKNKFYANTFQFRISFTFPPMRYNGQTLEDVSVVVVQNNRISYPFSIEAYPVQTTTQPMLFGSATWNRLGAVANFNAFEFDMNQPITIKVAARSIKEMTFTFTMQRQDSYELDKDEFRW